MFYLVPFLLFLTATTAQQATEVGVRARWTPECDEDAEPVCCSGHPTMDARDREYFMLSNCVCCKYKQDSVGLRNHPC